MRKLLFTDLDGTLLDHHDYDYSAALPAISELNAQDIPWIMTTSKTAAEVIELKQEINNPYAFIVENGAGIFWPPGQLKEECLPSHTKVNQSADGYDYISMNEMDLADAIGLLRNYREQLNIKCIGFSEMSAQQVADCTGLPLHKAEQAKQRYFSEPLLWQDSESKLYQLQEMLAEFQWQLVKGGRFVHLMGPTNKGQALQYMSNYYFQDWQDAIETMALGDGNNDIALLEACDYPVIIRSPVNAPPKVNHSKVVLSDDYGPKGWNQAVLNWLAD